MRHPAGRTASFRFGVRCARRVTVQVDAPRLWRVVANSDEQTTDVAIV